jgi:hypothetical protein
MMNFTKKTLPFLFFIFPALTAAQVVIPPTVLKLVGLFSTTILNPIIAVLFGLALAYFIYGIVLYLWNPDNELLREQGKRNMFWGIIGLTIMVSVFGIMRFVISSIGADPKLLDNI